MVSKLFKLISFIMIGYTIYMVRMRPGLILTEPSNNKKTINKDESLSIRNSSRSFLDELSMKVEVVNLKGNIVVERAQRPLELKEGLQLRFKDLVKTGPSSVVIIKFAGNSILKLFSNSILEIGRIQHPDRTGGGKQYNFFHLKKGAILSDFINQGDRHILEITSGTGKIQVRGTQFLYLYNINKNRSQLAVLEGLVKAFGDSQGNTEFLTTGHGLVIKRGELLPKASSTGWIENIDWNKLAKGTEIDLYNPNASEQEQILWKQNRAELKKMPSRFGKKNLGNTKKKATGLIKNIMGKVLETGEKLIEGGKKAAKSASPVGQINEAAENIKNLEQNQKDRIKQLDSL